MEMANGGFKAEATTAEQPSANFDAVLTAPDGTKVSVTGTAVGATDDKESAARDAVLQLLTGK